MIMNKHNTFPSSSTKHTNIEDAELGSESFELFLQDATSIITCGHFDFEINFHRQ